MLDGEAFPSPSLMGEEQAPWGVVLPFIVFGLEEDEYALIQLFVNEHRDLTSHMGKQRSFFNPDGGW